MTERYNQTFKQMLAAYINMNQDNWDEFIHQLNMAYNTSVHKATKFTPFELLFGRKAKIPIDVIFPSLNDHEKSEIPVDIGNYK